MIKSFWIKFLILLCAVSVIALSAAFVLRELMIRDFQEYLEGEREDRVYWITADIEGTYDKHGHWNRELLGGDAIWALMLGYEMRVFDHDDILIMDTEQALASLSPLMRSRVPAVSELPPPEPAGPFVPYPLFIAGKEIGRLDVRFLKPGKDSLFIERSNTFLLFSLLALGGLALVLSVIVSKKLTRPIKRLTTAAAAISNGDLKARVPVSGRDELERLSESFNAMAYTLEAQETLRRKILSNTAHELRTPLTVMKGELEGMADGLIPTDRTNLESLLEETGRLRNILDGMEELAQAQASALTLKKQQIDLEAFLAQVVSRFRALDRESVVEYSVTCEKGLRVNADPDRLSQIMLNLLSNAFKATDKGGRVAVRAARKGDDVLIEVRDTGSGIRPEDLPFIFERFFKASDGGLGLGLAIVKELVEAHGGRIEAKSEYGKGTDLTLLMPSR